MDFEKEVIKNGESYWVHGSVEFSGVFKNSDATGREWHDFKRADIEIREVWSGDEQVDDDDTWFENEIEVYYSAELFEEYMNKAQDDIEAANEEE